MAVTDLPRLLLCCFDVVPAPTAVSRRMTEYLKGLSERFQVVVLTVKTPDHTHIERYHGARLLRVPVGSGDLAARVQAFDRAVRRQLDSEEYVMVHSFDPFGGYALCERRSEFGYKIVYDASALPSVDLPHLHEEAEVNRRFIARVRRQELFCLMNADQVIVANDLTREFVTSLGVAREQVLVLPSPVDLTPYTPEVMGAPDATPMKLLHLGNLSTANDLVTLLEALQVALQSVDVTLTIVGPRHPAHQARLEEKIAELKLTGKVDFQDPVAHDDVHKVLATADVGLVTLTDLDRNQKTGSPLSRIAEYMAAGRPIIAADVGAARAVLSDEVATWYQAGDKASLAEAIVSLASEPARRVKLGKAARAAAIVHDGFKIRADLFASYVALSGTGIRAVGDAESTTPDEPTQLGKALAEDTKERKLREDREAAAREAALAASLRATTDPNLAAADTSPEAALSDRPAVLGTPIREEEPPIVMGTEARALAAELAQVTTEPNALRPTEPPVVMGTPLPPAKPEEPVAPPSTLTPGDLAEAMAAPVAPARGRRKKGEKSGEKPAARASAAATTAETTPAPTVPTPTVPDPIPVPTAPAPPPMPAGDEPLSLAPTTDPTAAPAPIEAPGGDAGKPIEELPDTGSHLSLVPKSPPPPPPPLARPSRTALPVVPPELKPPSEPTTPFGAARREPLIPTPSRPEPTLPYGAGLKPPAPPPLPPVAAAPPPPLPPRPAPSAPSIFIPPLQMPPMPGQPAPASSGSGVSAAYKPSISGTQFPVVPVPSAPQPGPSTSGLTGAYKPSPSGTQFPVIPIAPAVAKPPEFVPLLTPPSNVPMSSPSPLPARVPPAPRTASGAFAVLSVTPAAPPPPAPVEPAPAGLKPSGLFPEPPRIPYQPPEPVAISEDEIEEVEDETGGPEELSDDELMEVASDVAPSPAVTAPPPAAPITTPGGPSSTSDEAPEMAAEDAGLQTVDTEASPPPSAIDPWLAMLVHGYCPPESGLFNRHTPPTTMPGRDT
ncbi:MAG: glycosyltransferase [Myxococcaceae bacterium]